MLVVLVLQDVVKLEGVEMLEYLVLAVLLLPYFICFSFAMPCYIIFILSNLCICNSSFVLLLHSLSFYLLFSPYSCHFYFVYYLWSYIAFRLITGLPFLILRSMTIQEMGSPLLFFEILDEPPCYVRQYLLLMLNCLEYLGDWCHVYSRLFTLQYTTACLQAP